ncbi:flagellar protein FlgN [Shewanella sp. 10N.286.54.B9]|uniref:flagellar protein FlgN n=1 Tax=Shewanella sp. 10N.286.54.B9 TaxID=3229719 RepID=UPI00354CC315
MVEPISKSAKRETIQGIVRGIRQDIDGYKQLKSLLKRQRELMQRRDNQGLHHHNEHQSNLCNSLMIKAAERKKMLELLGFQGSASGMRSLIERLPESSSEQVAMLWNNLVSLVKESKQVNEANGKLLVGQQEVINQLLQRDQQPSVDYGEKR